MAPTKVPLFCSSHCPLFTIVVDVGLKNKIPTSPDQGLSSLLTGNNIHEMKGTHPRETETDVSVDI